MLYVTILSIQLWAYIGYVSLAVPNIVFDSSINHWHTATVNYILGERLPGYNYYIGYIALYYHHLFSWWRLDSPIATLVKCEAYFFVCIGEVNDIVWDLKHVKHVALEFLSNSTIQISYQILFFKLVPATFDSDPEERNDWHWSQKCGSSHHVTGKLVEPLNPTICTCDSDKLFYLFKSDVLMAIGSSLLERLTSESAKSLAKVKRSNNFPYHETSDKTVSYDL